MAGVSGALLGAAARLYECAWECRRAAYARGWKRALRVGARVVSIGNLGVGGAGKTTLVLHLAAAARAAGVDAAVVCRRYRPGPAGHGDEELLYRAAVGDARTFAGTRKVDLAGAAASAGSPLVIVDDGFSHWALARDLDVVLVDAHDPWSGGRMLPAGRLREPRRALQRAGLVIVSRLAPGEDPEPWFERLRPWAPAARFAAGRHRVTGVRGPDGERLAAAGPAHVVTATGNPAAVARSAAEAGFGPVTLAAYRDHHWFAAGEARREGERAGGGTLLVTAKDAVRWPAAAARRPAVLEVAWEWCACGAAAERMIFGGDE